MPLINSHLLEKDRVDMKENDLKKVKEKMINKLMEIKDQKDTKEEGDNMSETMDENAQKKLKEILMSIAKNEIRLSYQETKETLPICSSKIGGKPAVPADFQWPEFTAESYDGITKSRPLSFMAQIRLEEVASYDTEGILPKKGVLSFFYEQMSMLWGYDPKHKGCARVYYFSDETELVAMDIPEDLEKDAVIPELAVTWEKHISLPAHGDFVEQYSDMDVDWDGYYECSAKCGYEMDSWGDVTKLLGYPDTIQSPMEEECETVSRGYRMGEPLDYAKISETEKQEIEERAADWILLFQMGTIETEEAEFMFGDCGHLYFWIRKQDLQNLDFDKVWLILQCS